MSMSFKASPDGTYGEILVNGAVVATLPIAGNAVVPGLVGTVSQSGGVPTGAVIERGSNANGGYVRFADGTQICWQYLSEVLRSIDGTIVPFPAAFTANTATGGIFIGSSVGATRDALRVAEYITYTVDAGWVYSSKTTGTALAADRTRCIAIGRWF